MEGSTSSDLLVKEDENRVRDGKEQQGPFGCQEGEGAMDELKDYRQMQPYSCEVTRLAV